MIEPDKLQQLQMFVAWERKTNPGREHIAEWALGEIERLRIGHERYETARRLHPRAWDDAYTLSLKTGKPFDQVIDAEIRYIASFHGLLNRTKGGEIGCIQVDAREVLKRRAQLMLRRAEKAGNGDHPLVALVRAEAENPSPNVLSWGDDGRPVFGWRADKPSVHPSCKMKRGGVYA